VHLEPSRTRLRAQTTDDVIRSVPFTDIGEPCSTELSDGRIVTVYYWTNGPADPMRYIAAAIYALDENDRGGATTTGTPIPP
jgi:hypothetical protein